MICFVLNCSYVVHFHSFVNVQLAMVILIKCLSEFLCCFMMFGLNNDIRSHTQHLCLVQNTDGTINCQRPHDANS